MITFIKRIFNSNKIIEQLIRERESLNSQLRHSERLLYWLVHYPRYIEIPAKRLEILE